MTIRPFHNGDLPALAELWNQHWTESGRPANVSQAAFEQAILARTFFDPKTMLIGAPQGEPQGWGQLLTVPGDPSAAVISGMVLGRSAALELGNELLAATEAIAGGRNIDTLRVGVARDDLFGYAGLNPIGHGVGVYETEHRIGQILSSRGYQPAHQYVRMVAITRGYRMPVSRESMQLRRSTSVNRFQFFYPDPRQASAMSHLDVQHSQLLDRTSKDVANLRVWLSDAEAEVMSPSTAILDISPAHARGHLTPAETYLTGAIIESLAPARIESIETAVDVEHVELLAQLRAMKFEVAEHGACWVKKI